MLLSSMVGSYLGSNKSDITSHLNSKTEHSYHFLMLTTSFVVIWRFTALSACCRQLNPSGKERGGGGGSHTTISGLRHPQLSKQEKGEQMRLNFGSNCMWRGHSNSCTREIVVSMNQKSVDFYLAAGERGPIRTDTLSDISSKLTVKAGILFWY